MREFFDRITIGDWLESAIRWILSTFPVVWDFIEASLEAAFTGLSDLLNLPPAWLLVTALALLAWFARGWPAALVGFVGLLLIDVMGQWQAAMETLAMVLVCVVIAALLSIPIGILAARSAPVSAVVRPVLDFMQTMPVLLYLLFAVMFFGLGAAPGMVATIIFAMPPGIRLTELGIRQVDPEVVEAGHAFGSPGGTILRQIQLPLAMPTVMAGINQIIMLALSMVVLAGLAGGGGLGRAVAESLSRLNYSLGIEAGLSVVILAIYLDRVTAALGARSRVARLARTG